MNRLEVSNLCKTYKSGSDEIRILHNVDLELSVGKSVAVVGASGSGKSTFLNLIGGLDKADSGLISCCGYNVSGLPERQLNDYRAQRVGFIFQFHYLLKDFSALENVMLPMVMTGKSRAQSRAVASGILEQVKLHERLNHYPIQLSGGERQRVALARALVNSPDIILADEPTGNLDNEHKNLVADNLFELCTNDGRSLVLVTHANDLAQRADSILRLSDGELLLV